MRLAHQFLQNFCLSNQNNQVSYEFWDVLEREKANVSSNLNFSYKIQYTIQVLLHKHLELFLNPDLLHAKTMCAIFQVRDLLTTLTPIYWTWSLKSYHIRTMQCCAMKSTRKWFNTSSTASRATGSMCSTWGSSRPSSTRSRSSLGGVKTWSCRCVPAWNERFLFKCEQPPLYQELVNAGEDVLIFYNDKVIFHPVPSFGAAFSFSSIHCPLLGRLALFFSLKKSHIILINIMTCCCTGFLQSLLGDDAQWEEQDGWLQSSLLPHRTGEIC